MNSPDKHLEQRARELYHEASRRIDPVTAGRLRAARRQALAAANGPKHRASHWLIPSGAFAAIALATLMVWQPVPHDTLTLSSQAISVAGPGTEMDTELPPDADKTDPNLYQNLDFYSWLAANSSQHDQPAKH
jgi:hypothetical protein